MEEDRRVDRERKQSQKIIRTEEEMEEDRRVDRERIQSYKNNLHRDKNKIATRMEEILNGDMYIEPLHERRPQGGS